MSDFQRLAIERVIDKANAAGVSTAKIDHLCGVPSNHGALTYARLHPNDKDPDVPAAAIACCWGSANGGLEDCTCWTAVYDVEQGAPRPPTSADDMQAQPRQCGDCAFRKGSPERSETWTEEALFSLAESGTPFWCHQGMRRPAYWQHPAGMRVDGSPDDWTPPIITGIPYRADGSPGLLCAGWMSRTIRAKESA